MSCLLLPAVQFQDGSVILGWKVGLAAISELPPLDKTINDVLLFLAGLGNVVIAFTPLALYVSNDFLYRVLAVLGLVLFGIAASFYAPDSGFGSGYYMWVIAFLIMALGFGLLAIASPHNNAAQPDAAEPRGWP